MQILKHRKRPDGSYRLLVWLDETKELDGEPDPAYVRRFDYAPKPQGITQADYVAMQRRETKLLLEHEAAVADTSAGTSMQGEGDPL